MLKIPYEGSASLTGSNINIRSHVLSGGRPPLSTKVLFSYHWGLISNTFEVLSLRYKSIVMFREISLISTAPGGIVITQVCWLVCSFVCSFLTLIVISQKL